MLIRWLVRYYTEDDGTTNGGTSEKDAAPPAPAPQGDADDFDKDRAMATITKLRGFEKEAKVKLRRLEELEAKEQERSDKELSESDKLRKQLDALQRQHDAAQAEIKRARLLESARRAAEKANLSFHAGALEDALTLGAFDALELDDDGKPKEMPEAVRRLAKERPYLLKSATAATGADLDATKRGTTSKDEEAEAKLQRNATRWGIRLPGSQ